MLSSANRSKLIAPNNRIRVLVVDDSIVIRKLVSQALAEDPAIEVAGSAPNGVVALQKISQLRPDVVTLDIEMPEMDGLETLRNIRKTSTMPVIMFSTLTERGAQVTLEALSLGASDYVTKAANVGSLEKSMMSLRSELVPKIKQFFHLPSAPKPIAVPVHPVAAPKLSVVPRPSGLKQLKRIVVIGVSTGGPNALATVMPMFPADFPLPILIVQHMPPIFTRFLAERMNAVSSIKVSEVAEGQTPQAGQAVIAAGGYHMRTKKSGPRVVLTMDQEPPENSCRPAVDVLFRSVADVYGASTIGVMLTGMGSDGLKGVESLTQAGAYIIAQDEKSSVVWGMPGAVVKAGLAHSVVDLECIVPEIIKQI